MGFAEIIVIVV